MIERIPKHGAQHGGKHSGKRGGKHGNKRAHRLRRLRQLRQSQRLASGGSGTSDVSGFPRAAGTAGSAGTSRIAGIAGAIGTTKASDGGIATRIPSTASSPISDMTAPPSPPIRLTPAVAVSPDTPQEILWHIAQHAPELRRWLVANPRADAILLEYISQAGGPGVKQALEVLLESLEDN
ncbi:hypothetical protein [Bifidobacterium oedipodis]|uniref:Leucine rich repeat variant domain-containing protein n=1 Tax=Bifidobacterium oedipodis TaxID=2675322 RepID=A0A7Y0ER49_9BIFI|nr:hypothetical protein [Bifidobacterium sp. DSM 109957]NMM94913.1 hypothetical protein [Bifidobacterium sp. DSM 109957]